MANGNTKRAKRARFDYDAYSIAGKSMQALVAAAADIKALGRRTTEQAFELGALLEEAAALVEPRTFGKWVEQVCDISGKTARNYRAVSKNLVGYRDRAIELSITPTVLFHLASASEDKIEAALLFAEENDGIHVKEVKALLEDDAASAGEETDELAVADMGGVAGLRALIDLKTKVGMAMFLEHASALQAVLLQTLTSKAEGKRLQKGQLLPLIEPAARVAKRSLGNVLLLDAAGDTDARRIDERELPAGSRWFSVFETLDHLGNRERWPGAKELELWLKDKAMPTLAWATTRAKQPEWPLASRTIPQPDALMRTGLESLGGAVRIEPPALVPSIEAEGEDDFEPPAFLARAKPAQEVPSSNVVSLDQTNSRGLKRAPWVKSKDAQPLAD
ncbi:hypothetical protein ACQZ6F_19210 [Rhizobium sp. A22-96]